MYLQKFVLVKVYHSDVRCKVFTEVDTSIFVKIVIFMYVKSVFRCFLRENSFREMQY